MPIEVIRFGVGHRRPDGPPGTKGIAGQVIHSDGRGIVAELAFSRNALIEPHSNPNTTYFIVIEGGGWVVVGEERLRVAAGDAVVWPPHLVHGAWTEHGPMRALVVELAGSDDGLVRAVMAGEGRALEPAAPRVSPGEGRLADRPRPPHREDRTSGEPL